MQNCYSFDYLTVSFKGINQDDVLDYVLRCFSSNPDIKSDYFIYYQSGTLPGYNRSLRFLDKKYFTINWYEGEANEKYGEDWRSVSLVLSGQGCHYLTFGDFYNLFTTLKNDNINYKITRLDIAFDDFNGFIPKDKILKNFNKFMLGSPCVVGPFHAQSVKFYSGIFNGKGYTNLTLGSRASGRMLRLYDKKAEQKRKDLEIWERLEIQLKQHFAGQFMDFWLETKDLSNGFVDTLESLFRIVSGGASRPSNNPTASWYKKFVSDLRNFKAIYDDDCLKMYILRSDETDEQSESSLLYFKPKKARCVRDEYDSLVLNLFHQYGRAISFMVQKDFDQFSRLVEAYAPLVYDKPKYSIFDDLFSNVA